MIHRDKNWPILSHLLLSNLHYQHRNMICSYHQLVYNPHLNQVLVGSVQHSIYNTVTEYTEHHYLRSRCSELKAERESEKHYHSTRSQLVSSVYSHWLLPYWAHHLTQRYGLFLKFIAMVQQHSLSVVQISNLAQIFNPPFLTMPLRDLITIYQKRKTLVSKRHKELYSRLPRKNRSRYGDTCRGVPVKAEI